MPNLTVIPMDAVIVAEHATDVRAIVVVDLEPISVRSDATVNTVGVGDDGSRYALDA